MLGNQLRHHGLDAGGVGLVEQDARCGVALRDGGAFLLDDGDARARFLGGDGGGDACSTSAYDHDVVILRGFHVLDRLGCAQEARKPCALVACRGGCGGRAAVCRLA